MFILCGGEVNTKQEFSVPVSVTNLIMILEYFEAIWPLDSHVIQSLEGQKQGFALCSLVALRKTENMKWLDLFGRLKSVAIGMIHVKALPGNVAVFLLFRLEMEEEGFS